MSAPINLPGPTSNPGYEVWQIEAAADAAGPWEPVNAGASGSPLRAAFSPHHRYWRVSWTAYTGAVLEGQAAPLPTAGGPSVNGRRGTHIRLVN